MVNSEDFDQAAQMRSLINVFVVHSCVNAILWQQSPNKTFSSN